MTPEDAAREKSLGGVFVFSAYVLWGFLPLYFVSLAPTTPWEVVGWRIVLSLVFCVALIAVTRGWGRMRAILRDRRLMLWTLVAGLLIYVNWQVFLIGTLTGHVVETSLGYFINPIATVLLGVLVLKERLRPAQWVAVGIAVAAVVVIIVAVGDVPWIALALAASFATYGLVKKRIGPSVDAVSGLTLESFWLVPIAVIQLVAVGVTSGLTMGREGSGHMVLLLLAGAVTAIPLLFFSAGARRTSLTVVGILQFIAPVMQFLTGVLILQEPMPFERWIGFGLVWVAIAVFAVDSLLASRRERARAVTAVPDPV
ncbi:chloramphenicol-sensitive protein RarD [Microbacterium sp. LKL04]|uniref:EamA family transporter RarD n=1 Tax=unclassified Microbacterium TaxID=2609290 RepID=UPI000875E16B|nr:MULTISPECIES: EamA family transporter RarD [unclassified Microbacterium]MDQ1125453.1 chloramphenicol-sensitive protein RarD [Microbacterium sp. SORGH_AS_0505]SCY46135.1 chloramphenicol-sensitive protein RarD [Microbacterium sp. LKL04]